MAERGGPDAWSGAAGSFYDGAAGQKAMSGFQQAFAHSYRRLSARLNLPEKNFSGIFRLLDLGCGTGELPAALENTAVQITGIDVSAESLKIARLRNPRAEFHQTSMTALPFPGCSFDAAAAITSLEFCQDKKSALAEVRRVLRPGGYFYAEVRNADFCLYRLPPPALKILKLLKIVIPYQAEGFRDLGYLEWRSLLQQSGFTIEGELTSLRPWNYGGLMTRTKNLLIELIKMTGPVRRHYMIGFLCRA